MGCVKQGLVNHVEQRTSTPPKASPNVSKVNGPVEKNPTSKPNGKAHATDDGKWQWQSEAWVSATAKLCDVSRRPQEPLPLFADRVRQALNAKLRKPEPPSGRAANDEAGD